MNVYITLEMTDAKIKTDKLFKSIFHHGSYRRLESMDMELLEAS